MNINVNVGDVLECPADVLISTANPWLNMSGGVNGAILAKNGKCIQQELREYQAANGKPAVPAGTVVRTSVGSLPFRKIIHAVAIAPFYDSSVKLVRDTLTAAFSMALDLKTQTVAMPTLATGYGPMSIAEFAVSLAPFSHNGRFQFERVTVVVRNAEYAGVVEKILKAACL